MDPRYALAWANLADAQSELGKLADAIASYRRALECSPGNHGYLINLATALSRRGDQAAAIEICRHAVQTFPASATAWHTMAIALERSGDLEQAIDCERKALAIEPAFVAGWHALGNLLDDAGRLREAADAYRRALELAPALTAAAFDLAALGEAPAPAVMPREYTTNLFNDFAATFDRRLVGELAYQAPRALRELMNDCLRQSHLETRQFDILDLGCGTGLVGREFRDLAASLVGVDLSAGMLAQAEQAGVYDDLDCREVVEFMQASDRRFDMILAADLFIYIGDLSPVFSSAAKVLREEAWFAFSIETIDAAPYALRRTRRYAHSLAYLRDLAADSGFRWIAARETPIREGPAGAVPGHVVALQRTAGG
jgi:predicted TPR repeat methyltransferase